MALVEIWDQVGTTGHASIRITKDSYCSFHPRNSDISDVPREMTTGSPGVFYKRSVLEEEHGQPIAQIDLNFLDTKKMEDQFYEWITDAKSGHLKYHFLGTNCSRIAAHILCIGAGINWTLFKHIDHLAAQIKRLPMHHDSGRITELIQDGIEDYAVVASRTRTLAKSRVLPVLLGLDVLSRALVWTPGDVLKLAKLLQPHNH